MNRGNSYPPALGSPITLKSDRPPPSITGREVEQQTSEKHSEGRRRLSVCVCLFEGMTERGRVPKTLPIPLLFGGGTFPHYRIYHSSFLTKHVQVFQTL